MLAAAALAVLVAGTAFVVTVPAEPGATFLTEEPTYQAVAADLDADGSREVVLLVRGEGGAILAEAWALRGDAWDRLGSPVGVVPGSPTGDQGSVEWGNAPVRLLVRSVEGADRVTLVRQPAFEEPGLETTCCLLLDDLVVVDGALRLTSVTSPSDLADAVSVLDLDGDGTDELLVSRSLTPLGDIGFPTEVRLFRWRSVSFGAPTVSELAIGSGDTPFVLGDSDGVPGEEAAIIATLGRPAFYRLALGDGDALRIDDAGVVVADALAVPVGDGRGVAIVDSSGTLVIHSWPRGERLGPVLGGLPIGDGTLVETIEVHGVPHLAVLQQRLGERLQVVRLPDLAPPRFGSTSRTAAAAGFVAGPVQPYVGAIPGGGPDGGAALLFGGRLLPAVDHAAVEIPTAGTAMATLAGAQPIGFVGPERSWLALLHAPVSAGTLDPSGGRLEPATVQPGSAVSVAPVSVVMTPEADDGGLEPQLDGAVPISPRRTLAVGAEGFTARVRAPPGSRLYVGESDPSVVHRILTVPASGVVPISLRPPGEASATARYRTTLSVTTPAGHAYLATWDVRVLTEPPRLEATTFTPFGSTAVEVIGRTAPHASVEVAGVAVPVDRDGSFRASVGLPPWPTSLEVTATDPVGNQAQASVVGVGVLDYRALPWIGIVAALVAAAAVALYLRVPRTVPQPRQPGDDAALEEIDPD